MAQVPGVLTTALAGAMGAAAYQQYHDMKDSPTGAGIQAFMDKVRETNFHTSADQGGGGNAQNEALMRQLNDIQRQLSMQPRGGGVIMVPSGRGGGTMVLVVGVAGVAGILYLRFVKGIAFSDMFFTTTHALKQMRASMAEGMERMGDKLNAVREFLQQQLDLVARKQDDITAKQDLLAKSQEEARLEQQRTGEGVDRLEGNLESMRGNVAALQGEMSQIAGQLQHTNTGIALMCQAFGESMSAMGMASSQVVSNLNTYLHASAPNATLPPPTQQRPAPSGAQMIEAPPASEGPATTTSTNTMGLMSFLGGSGRAPKPAAKPATAGANFAAHLKGGN